MKTKILLITVLALGPVLCALSQIPQGFNYQAIARDGDGNPITGATIKVKLSILSDTTGFYSGSGGVYIWEEEHTNVKTNSFGMFTVVLGSPTAVKVQGSAASFSAIDWSPANLFVGTKIANPTTYKVMGSAELWSVPYALMADEISGSVKKLTVAGETTNMEEPLFEVKNRNGRTVFAVYNEGVRAYVSDGDAKGVKGGFAIGSFDATKGERDLFVVTTDSIRAYIYDDPLNKGVKKGGFAIGGFDNSKGLTNDYLLVSPDSVRIYLDHTTGKAVKKGGFAIGSFDASKGMEQEYLRVSRDSVRIYIDDEVTKAVKGGFAIGSFDAGKAGKATFFDVSPNTDDIILSENRILWYPVKNAFLTGRIKIEKPDSVGENSFASGYESKAKGQYSQALGFQAIARGDNSTSIGYQSVAHKNNAFAFGQFAQARNEETYAFGRGAIAEGFRSFAFGSAGVDSAGQVTGVAYAKGDYSFAIGQGSRSLERGAFAFGLSNTASGLYSMAIGYKTEAKGYYSTAMGAYTTASGDFSTAMGYLTTASRYFSTAMGAYTNAPGNYSTAMGIRTTASGDFSTAMGYLTTASRYYSTAMGIQTTASGDFSTAMGDQTTASGTRSTAMGYLTTASGDFSTAMGANTTASGTISTAMGANTTASGDFSTAMGYLTTASGFNSTAMGAYTTAPGGFSTAMGYKTTTPGYISTAMGHQTTASGNYSTAMGSYTKANTYSMVAVGSYNDTTKYHGNDSFTTWFNDDPLFVIGNGTSDNARSNAVTVFKNGNVGIGTTTPATRLDVVGSVIFRNDFSPLSIEINSFGTGNRHAYIDFRADDIWEDYSLRIRRYNTGENANSRIHHKGTGVLELYNEHAGPIAFYTNSTHRLWITPSGEVGIGTAFPTQTLDVNGNARFRSIGSGAYYGVVNRTSDGTLTTATSDIRLKENINTIQGGLSKVLNLRGIYFNWITEPEMGRRVGMIAQEVEEVIPELVFTNEVDGYKGINYAEMSAVLIEAIKEQQSIIESQNQENKQLRSELESLKERLSALEAMVSNK